MKGGGTAGPWVGDFKLNRVEAHLHLDCRETQSGKRVFMANCNQPKPYNIGV